MIQVKFAYYSDDVNDTQEFVDYLFSLGKWLVNDCVYDACMYEGRLELIYLDPSPDDDFECADDFEDYVEETNRHI